MLPKVKAELERMVKCGVIMEITEPTEWCAPMVLAPKRTADVRICAYLKRLNMAVKRERFHLTYYRRHTATTGRILCVLPAQRC